MASPSSTQLLSLPSSSSSNKQWTYDVFLSFRGKDTRKSFTDHLYAALTQQGIFTFRDDEQLERGKPISSKLLQAIEESRIALVVFSKNYASSTWCLDEIAKIVKCMEEMGQIVFPIFYDVDPSEVRKQTGSFAEAFVAHEKRFKDSSDKVQGWRTSLTQVANLFGFHLQDRHESDFIQEIIEKILRSDWICTLPTVSKDLVGISCRVKKMMELCSRIENENDVEFIGIWGMSGTGKTTLAQAFYDEISTQFQARSFLENVREVSKRGGIAAVQEKLLFNLQMKSETIKWHVHRGISEISYRLRHKKVLIVIDDVDKGEQLEALAGNREWFGPGSRIIITTRDEQLLIAYGVDKRLKAKELTSDEALELFSRKVFKNDYPPKDYMGLSHDFVDYVKGHPLAINVLARLLCGKSTIEWKYAFTSLKINLQGEIMSTLRVGFDGLSDPEKQIFLDIACFFKGMDRDHVTKILESLGFNPVFSIGVLIRKSLITIVGRNLWMHDLLQEMGWEIVRQECPKDPGNCSRLWHLDDVLDILKYNKGTDAVEGMVLNLPPEVQPVNLDCDAFSKMKKLRYLRMSDVLLPQDLNYLSTELQVIEWHGYPSKLLPQNFPSSKLVQLNMCRSHIKHLWKGMKALDKLKYIDLSDSESLIETPDFTGAPNLEILIFEGCSKLSKVHPSISILKKLTLLNLRNCESLKTLPSSISLESLETAILSGCAQLKIFPEIVGDMECLSKLYLDGTAIKELPLSIRLLTGLSLLDLSDCKNLLRLPSAICSLTQLKTIFLSRCSILDEIPQNIGGMECLEELDISGTAIRQMPSSTDLNNLRLLFCSDCKGKPPTSHIYCWLPAVCPATGFLLPSSFSGFSSLTKLRLDDCNLLDGAIPNDLHHLYSLQYLWLTGNNFTSLPETIGRLCKLITLSVRNCKHLQSLPELPICLEAINAYGCKLLNINLDQYEVWPADARNQLLIVAKRSKSRTCSMQISERQFESWLRRYHQDTLRTTHGITFAGPNSIPEWFNHRKSNSSASVELPTEFYTQSRPWIAYALYVDFVVLGDFDTRCDFKLIHEFYFFYNTENGLRDKQTLHHEVNVKDVPFTGSNGYWIYIPHLWFSQRVIDLNECSTIEAHTRADSAAVEVKMTGARLLYDQDIEGFVQAIKYYTRIVRIRKNKEEHSGGELKSTLREQGGEFTSTYSDSSRTHLSVSVEDQGCKIDSTISLPLRCYEGRRRTRVKYYIIRGKFTNPRTASTIKEIIQEYSGQHVLRYSEHFLQSEIPESFCWVKGSSALNARLDSIIGWKGIALCVSVAVHRDPSLIVMNSKNKLSENSYTINCCFESSNGWRVEVSSKIPKSEAFGLKRVGSIWIYYRSRGSFSNTMLDECTTMRVRFHTNSEDVTILSCGYQVVFHQNVDEVVETIKQ